MHNLRPALLALLLAAVGLGVPASFAQSSHAQPAGSPAKSHPKKKATPGSAPTKSSSSAKGPSAKTASGKAASHSGSSTGSKKGSSRRSRRQPGQKAPTSDRVNEIQTALAKDGSFAGTPNGKWDDGTSEAMRKFQAAHGLNPTGKLDALTLQKLGLGSQTAGVAAPIPPPGAVSRLTSSNSFSASDSPRRQ
jgi:peptidoglycan hydrolase-like protein with peptidoglycan-binding domain